MHARFRVVAAAVLMGLAACVVGPAPDEARAAPVADDGRVGVVADLQGTALVRPAGRTRWSPAGPRTVLLPGDDVRTLARGAHAAEIRLADGGSLVLGPGAIAHLDSRTILRLLEGDAEVTGAAGTPVAVAGPGGFTTRAEKATVLRAEGGATKRLDAPPRWLSGYRSSTTDEWMGSLLAKVDGRNVALTVGYHKVDVVLRDQIAETTVEQSFVNSTASTLEGVFTFPLPAGASVSGFGMWIGEELVEADIVEKERARAIYEDIKARKKDPGLLEWSGGNLFTANVFPIFGHSEKRVRLRYTQVLPLEGSLVRYRYALRSELLRTHPLRQLQIRIAAQSSAPIVSATSPTHEVLTTKSANTATFEFNASEFTPDRDFEVVLGLDGASPLRAVAHRRGDDGYVMVLLAPPDAAAAKSTWKRDLIPEGGPLDLVFVADTSGSMGPAERKAQRAFLEAALALLGEKDRFRLLACDANVLWLSEEALPATDENAGRALAFLDRRISLGWTDLDGALAAVAAKAAPGTHVVYVGDGIGTSGDADPVALAQRIGRMTLPPGAAIHAVAPGSAYEEGVLAAMAAKGAGSVRTTGDDPAKTATALLTEIAQPAVKDLRVAFEGVRTARVYPERLPNLAAGTQQIVLGRFLPSGAGAERGRVKVSGTFEGKPVSWDAEIVVAPGAEGAGNSFLPRLWARRHLDALLAEGRTPAIKDEIVSMSEQYGIITPYTSFLVLENDEDRERYGVTRRVAMRDGERFFTEGRTSAATEALRDAMRNARSWRIGMRKSMLREIAELGRSLPLGEGAAVGEMTIDGVMRMDGGHAGGGSGARARFASREALASKSYDDELLPATEAAAAAPLSDSDEEFEMSSRDEAKSDYEGPEGEIAADSREPGDPPPPPEGGGPGTPGGYDSGVDLSELGEEDRKEVAGEGWDGDGSSGPTTGGGDWARRPAPSSAPMGSVSRLKSWRSGRYQARYGPAGGWQAQQLWQRFPPLPAPPAKPDAPPEPTWDAEIQALLASVAETSGVLLAPGVRIEASWRDGGVGPSAPAWWPQSIGRGVVSAHRWLVQGRSASAEPWVHWLAEDRGAVLLGTRLGRRRPGAEGDRAAWGSYVGRGTYDYLRWQGKWTAKIESRDGRAVVVSLTSPDDAKQRVLVTIDTEKKVVVESRNFYDGKPTGSLRSSEFVEVGGLWWAGRTESIDAEGSTLWRRELAVREIPAPEFDAVFAAEFAGHDDVVFVGAVEPTRAAAKQADHDGRATFADLLTLVGDHVSYSRWDDAWATWVKARAAARTPSGKMPGLDWIEGTLLSTSRRGEQFAAWLGSQARIVTSRPGPAAYPLALLVDQLAQSSGQPNTRLALIDVLSRATDPAADPAELAWQAELWDQQRAMVLAQTGRWADAIVIWKAQWKARPEDTSRAMSLMNGYVATGNVDGALELVAALDLAKRPATDWMVSHMFQQASNAVWSANRYDTALELAERWIAARPADADAYIRRLSALLALGRIEEFDAWIEANLVLPAATQEEPERAAQAARLNAAVRQALGNDPYVGWYGGQTDPKWVRPLGAFARRAARDERVDASLVAQIVGDGRWRRTDAHREFLAGLREDLAAAGTIESLSAQRLASFVAWLSWDRNSVDAAVWRGVTDRVTARWRASKEEKERPHLLVALLRLLDQHLEPDEAARVLREELAVAPKDRAPGVASALLGRLVRTPWSQAMEDEAFALVRRLVTDDMPPEAKRGQFATAARWLVRKLVAVRTESALPSQVEREKLPRSEFRALQKKTRAEVRSAFAARLLAETKTAPDLLRPWLEVERLCFAAESGEDAKTVEAEARELLLSAAPPAGLGTAAPPDDQDAVDTDQLTWVLRERAVLVLSYAAIRRDAPEGLSDRVEALLRERLEKDEKAQDWRYAIFRLLVAQDRTDAVETALRSWIVPEKVESRWRRALGYVLAEKGKVQEAAEQFEEVAKLGEMTEAEFVTLASWYLVLGDDARREDTLDRRYGVVADWVLQNRVGQERWRVQSRSRDGVPETMDDEILRVIRVMLSKSSQPQNGLWNLVGLYQATKDFRVLASLADGVVGHTPEATYPFLEGCWNILREVHEEATCDEIRARLEERRTKVTTDTDRRAVSLLMVLCERRAAEVLNQRGPHAERALDALKSARQGAWLPGERRLMANFLGEMGKIPDAALAAEQNAQLKELHEAEAAGTPDRVQIASSRWRTAWVYDRADEAIDGLVAALEEHRQAQGGRLPAEANGFADTLTEWQEHTQKFGAGESWLVAEMARQPAGQQKEWYERRLFRLWVAAQLRGGTVAFGSGADLYRGARARIEKALAEHSPERVDELIGSYCYLHNAAHAAKVPGVADDLIRFSRTLLVEVLPRFGQQNPWRVGPVAEAIRHLAGPLAALTFYVERLEAEPVWRRTRGRGYGGWNYFGHSMAKWRREAGNLGDLEPRLLAVVLAEEERDLTSEEARGREIYGLDWRDGFWSAKKEDFANVARRVLEQNRDAPGILRHTAQYLWSGLELRDEAIAVLEDAARRGRIEEDGRWALVQWEQDLERWAASLPHSEKLVAERPDQIDYRLANIRALHGVQRDEDGKALVDATQTHFADLLERRRGGRRAQTQLADVCVDCSYFDRAIVLYPLALTEERRWNRGGGANAELSRLYGQLSRCFSGFGRHDEAIDAASSAVVIWGATDANREGALQSLREALGAIPELAAWEEKWEAAATQDGTDAPILRVMLGELHLQRKEPDQALRHLLVARRMQPDDAAVHAAVVRACEMKQDAAATADAMATSLHHLPKQPDLYPKLADAFRALDRADDAERALTGLVEFAPTEADGHQRLAALRTAAKRHDDAALQWRQVVRIRSADPAPWFELARSLGRAGRKDEARTVLDEAAKSPWGGGQRGAIEKVSKEVEQL